MLIWTQKDIVGVEITVKLNKETITYILQQKPCNHLLCGYMAPRKIEEKKLVIFEKKRKIFGQVKYEETGN